MSDDKYLQKFASYMQQRDRQNGPSGMNLNGMPMLVKINQIIGNIGPGSGLYATVLLGGKQVKCILAAPDEAVLFQDPASMIPIVFLGGGGSSGMWRD